MKTISTHTLKIFKLLQELKQELTAIQEGMSFADIFICGQTSWVWIDESELEGLEDIFKDQITFIKEDGGVKTISINGIEFRTILEGDEK